MISIPPPYPLTDQGSALDPRPPMSKLPDKSQFKLS